MDKSWMLGFFRMNYFTFMKKWNKIELEYKKSTRGAIWLR